MPHLVLSPGFRSQDGKLSYTNPNIVCVVGQSQTAHEVDQL